MKKKSDSTAKKNAKLAAKHGCDPRTIRRWKAEGAPLDDASAMRYWIASRKNIPPRTATLSDVVSSKVEKSHANSEQPTAGSRSAYERLQAAELAAHGRVIELQDGNPISLKAAVQNWLAINRERRQTEIHLTDDERKSNVLVSWSEIEQGLKRLGLAMHHASNEAMDMVAFELAGSNDIPRCRTLIRKCVSNISLLSYSALVPMGVQPRMVAAIADNYFSNHYCTMADVEHLGRCLSKQMVQFATDAIASNPPSARSNIEAPPLPS